MSENSDCCEMDMKGVLPSQDNENHVAVLRILIYCPHNTMFTYCFSWLFVHVDMKLLLIVLLGVSRVKIGLKINNS